MSDDACGRGIGPGGETTDDQPRTIVDMPDQALVRRVARFVVDVFDGDQSRIDAYMGRFERASSDPVFARAVSREVIRRNKNHT